MTGVVLALVLLAAVVLRKAWVSDDAYITFRTLENFVRGHGLTWNPGERVQAYTHPLWLFLVAGFRAFTGEVLYTSLGLGLAVTLAAVSVLILGVAASPQMALLGLVVLALSRAFTDYSTSGLENPLTHLLLMTLLFLDRGRSVGLRRRIGFSLVASLCLLNRPDTLLLILPAWAVFIWRTRAPKSLHAVAAGMVPLVAWEMFSLLYYGMPIPNTAYAKLSTGLPRLDLIVQGLQYFHNSILWDPLTLTASLGGVILAITRRRDDMGPDRPGPVGRAAVSSRAWALGIIAYSALIIWVGGDFMSGRFFTAPLIVAVGLVVSRPLPSRIVLPAVAATLSLLLVPWTNPFVERVYGSDRTAAIDSRGIADERTYYADTRLFPGRRVDRPRPGLRWARQEAPFLLNNWRSDPYLKLFARLGVIDPEEEWPPKNEVDETGRPFDTVIIRGAVGFLGYCIGSDAYIADYYGLGDPLLSHLPVDVPDPVLAELEPRIAGKGWRIGHFYRRLPNGYLHTLATGRNQLRDPRLARYYDAIRRIARDPVFEKERLLTIWKFHTGAYNGLIHGHAQGRADAGRQFPVAAHE